MAISLSNVVRVTSTAQPRVVLYGMGGLGKSTFGREAPNPVFLPTEAGYKELQGVAVLKGDPNADTIQSWPEMLDCVGALIEQPHDYKTAVIDTLDNLEPMLWKYVCETVRTDKGERASNIEDFGFYKGQRTHAPRILRELLDGLDILVSQRGMAVVLIAHHRIKKFEPPDTTAYEQYQIKLDEGCASLVFDWADAVLFMNNKVHVKTEGKGHDERARAIGSGERVLYAQERPAWRAKNRYGLPLEIPAVKGQSWAAFQEAIDKARGAKLAPTPNHRNEPQLATAT